ncbi:MAG TPA: 50S ribosomal protein L4 [Candidatus Dojkabacteria bacterium]|nr:50S ribosomal protein L4 [Candidatus Dojkabacteria bacterium]
MKATILNSKTEIELNDKVWAETYSEDLISQAVLVYLSNQRQSKANAKTRAEVDGGGRKPWAQKGTGRARQGSIRSPLWYKGGVTFGPSTDTNWSRKINKKMNRKAMRSAIARMLKTKKLFFVDFDGSDTTKKARTELLALKNKGSLTLVSDKKEVVLGLRNVEDVNIARPSSINIFDLTRSKQIFVDKNAVNKIEDILSK